MKKSKNYSEVEIKNEADVRKFSIVTQEKILLKNHLVWLNKCIADPKRHLYVITDGNRIVGDLRFDEDESGVEVSVRIDKEHRGRGIGSLMVATGCARALRWKACTVKSGLCGFTKGPAMCSVWSLRGAFWDELYPRDSD
jgi:GNAT superfamily N-acetyltransferase